MIRTLRIKNFKCFQDQLFALRPLTLLTGVNGTGKSSVLQSLLVLRQSYNAMGGGYVTALLLNGDLIQLGTAKDIFYEGAADNNTFGFEIQFEQIFGLWHFEYDRQADVVKLAQRNVPDNITTTSLFNDDFHYLSAERLGPRTSFAMSDYWVRERRQLGPRGEYTGHFLSLFGNMPVLPTMLHPRENLLILRAQVEAWLSEVSPGVRLELEDYPQMDVVDLRFSFGFPGQVTSNAYRSTHVGFGLTYTLPILTAILSAQPGYLVLLENPEAHLHPSGQFQVGVLLARAAAAGVQLIVETHSDHILNGVRVAVREGLATSEQVQLHFFSHQFAAGELASKVESPNLDHYGRIDHWPDGFFDEWDKSLERLL